MLKFLKSKKAIVSPEFALVVPIFILIGIITVSLCSAYRIQNTLNRQTALLAEMLVNYPEAGIDEESGLTVITPLEDNLTTLTTSAYSLLENAVDDKNHEFTVGLVVEYINTNEYDENEGTLPPVYSFVGGVGCSGLNNEALNALTYEGGGNLTVPVTEVTFKILRVSSCLKDNGKNEWLNKFNMLMPTDYISTFVTARKNDDH